MTRFSLTLEESVKFSFGSQQNDRREIFVPKVSSYNILDLVKAINPQAKIQIIGRRPGEKLHEELISNIDALYTIDLKDFYVITPYQNMTRWKKENFMKYNNLKKVNFCEKDFSYTSNNNVNFLSVSTLKKILLNL